MSKHNYSQYSNKNANAANANRNKQVEKPIVTPKPQLVRETVETVTLPAAVEGKVAHCSKLNIREKPIVNSDIVCVLDVMSEVQIDVNKSTENWFYVCCANGAEGYCMKEYIDAHM